MISTPAFDSISNGRKFDSMGSVYMELPTEFAINASLAPRIRCPSSGIMVPTFSGKVNAFGYVGSASVAFGREKTIVVYIMDKLDSYIRSIVLPRPCQASPPSYLGKFWTGDEA